jgi:hypothetical protein
MTMGMSPPWREQRLWIRPRDRPGNLSMMLWSLAAKNWYAVSTVRVVLGDLGLGGEESGMGVAAKAAVMGSGAEALCHWGFRDLSTATSRSAGHLLMARVMETWLTRGVPPTRMWARGHSMVKWSELWQLWHA